MQIKWGYFKAFILSNDVIFTNKNSKYILKYAAQLYKAFVYDFCNFIENPIAHCKEFLYAGSIEEEKSTWKFVE